MGVLNIPYALGMELRDTGKFGMILPPGIILTLNLTTFTAGDDSWITRNIFLIDEILPAAEEIWKFHESFGNLMIEEYMWVFIFGNYKSIL